LRTPFGGCDVTLGLSAAGFEVGEGSHGFRRSRPHPIEGAVGRGPSDAKQLGQFRLGVGAVVQLEQVLGLIRFQLPLLA
jgi:hypothetical protein